MKKKTYEDNIAASVVRFSIAATDTACCYCPQTTLDSRAFVVFITCVFLSSDWSRRFEGYT